MRNNDLGKFSRLLFEERILIISSKSYSLIFSGYNFFWKMLNDEALICRRSKRSSKICECHANNFGRKSRRRWFFGSSKCRSKIFHLNSVSKSFFFLYSYFCFKKWFLFLKNFSIWKKNFYFKAVVPGNRSLTEQRRSKKQKKRTNEKWKRSRKQIWSQKNCWNLENYRNEFWKRKNPKFVPSLEKRRKNPKFLKTSLEK